jgi:hypothetical protein
MVIANAMANKLLKNNEGDARINVLKNPFNFGRIQNNKSKLGRSVPKWL